MDGPVKAIHRTGLGDPDELGPRRRKEDVGQRAGAGAFGIWGSRNVRNGGPAVPRSPGRNPAQAR